MAALFMAVAFPPTRVNQQVLSGHDKIDGPFGGESHIPDLQVFEDGKIIYAEDIKTIEEKPEHSIFECSYSSSVPRLKRRDLAGSILRSNPSQTASKCARTRAIIAELLQ